MSIRYFAYGSNMAQGVMTDHCPGHRYLDRTELPHHRLAFMRRLVRTGTGVADIIPAQGESVVSKSTCTHHFRVLREAGVIEQRALRTTRLNSPRREDLDARFPGLLDAVLQSAAAPV